ncbi:MAG: DUF3048 domain-containing protein [Actinomycetota bacterium]
MRSTRAAVGACGLVVALVASACSGGDDSSGEPTATTVSLGEPPDGSEGGSDFQPSDESTDGAPTGDAGTGPPPGAGAGAPIGDGSRAPLTGQRVGAAAVVARPAIAAVVDNADPALQGQAGLPAADLVVETVVEGGETRLLALFQSQSPGRIGPIRSARTQDVAVLSAFDTPVLATSGGNEGVQQVLGGAPLIDAGAPGSPDAYQQGNFADPHNLFTDSDRLWSLVDGQATAAPAQHFEYVGPNQEPAGRPVNGLSLTMGVRAIDWTWNAGSGWFERTQDGSPHLDPGSSAPLSAENVVVLVAPTQPSFVDDRSPEAQTVGTGIAYVFANGELLEGWWRRTGETAPFRLIDGVGDPLPLMPGRTWIEIAPVDAEAAPGEAPTDISVFFGAQL